MPLLKQAITDTKSAGFEQPALKLEQAVFATFTTSSEMLQEHGIAIKHFLNITKATLPPLIKEKLTTCLVETELACARWQKLLALLRRRRTPFE